MRCIDQCQFCTQILVAGHTYLATDTLCASFVFFDVACHSLSCIDDPFDCCILKIE